MGHLIFQMSVLINIFGKISTFTQSNGVRAVFEIF